MGGQPNHHTSLSFPGPTLSGDHLPGQRLPGLHGNDGTEALRYYPGRFVKFDNACWWLNIVDASRVVGHESLQPIQSVVLLEKLYQTRQRDGRREHPCRTATALFGRLWVWR
jgi:hypothetical protein